MAYFLASSLRHTRFAAVLVLRILFWQLLVTIGPLSGQEAAWPQQFSYGMFIIHSNAHEDIRRWLPSDLDELPHEVSRSLGLPIPTRPVYVYVFDKKTTYGRYIQAHFGPVPNRQALYIQSRGCSMVFGYCHSGTAMDVRHECTHALLHELIPLLPLWLDEGLAEYFEVSAEQRHAHPHHVAAVRWAARLRALPALEELERLEQLEDMTASDYRFAWAWVHYCLHGPKSVQEVFFEYVQALRRGQTTPSLSERLQHCEQDSRASATAHFRRYQVR